MPEKGVILLSLEFLGETPFVDLGLVQDRELRLIGTLMYQRADYEKAVHLVAEGKIRLAPLITHRYQFEEYSKAYEMIDNSGGKFIKVMIEV